MVAVAAIIVTTAVITATVVTITVIVATAGIASHHARVIIVFAAFVSIIRTPGC